MEELLVSKYPDESGVSDTCALLILRGEATTERDDQKKIRGQITLVHFDMQTHAHTHPSHSGCYITISTSSLLQLQVTLCRSGARRGGRGVEKAQAGTKTFPHSHQNPNSFLSELHGAINVEEHS